MSNIPEDIYIPLNTKRDKKNNKGLLGIGIPNFAVSLKEWVSKLFKGINGITFDSDNFTFKLGGGLTENTIIEPSSNGSFTVKIGDFKYFAGNLEFFAPEIVPFNGLVYLDTVNEVLHLFGLGDFSAIGISQTSGTFVFGHDSFFNVGYNEVDQNVVIFATNLTNSDTKQISITPTQIKFNGLEEFANDAAANLGGLTSDELYKNSTTKAITVKD